MTQDTEFVLFFSAIFLKYGRKIFLSIGTFFYPMFANCAHDVRSRFSKQTKLGFYENIDGFSEKKLDFLQKR